MLAVSRVKMLAAPVARTTAARRSEHVMAMAEVAQAQLKFSTTESLKPMPWGMGAQYHSAYSPFDSVPSASTWRNMKTMARQLS